MISIRNPVLVFWMNYSDVRPNNMNGTWRACIIVYSLIYTPQKLLSHAGTILCLLAATSGHQSEEVVRRTCTLLEKFGWISLYSMWLWWPYFKALCDVKFLQIEGNVRKFPYIELSNTSLKFSNSVEEFHSVALYHLHDTE